MNFNMEHIPLDVHFTEAKDIYEAAIFRQKLWEEMRKHQGCS